MKLKKEKIIIKKINKYLVSFDYLDKIFITLSASFGTLSIASYAAVVGLPVGIAGSNIIKEKTIYENIKENIKDIAELSSLEHIEENQQHKNYLRF